MRTSLAVTSTAVLAVALLLFAGGATAAPKAPAKSPILQGYGKITVSKKHTILVVCAHRASSVRVWVRGKKMTTRRGVRSSMCKRKAYRFDVRPALKRNEVFRAKAFGKKGARPTRTVTYLIEG